MKKIALLLVLCGGLRCRRLQGLEQAAGRERPWHHAPRTLDLDIVLYGDTVVHDSGLTIPHARMLERAFVMVPLAEVAPDMPVPGHGTVRELAAGVDAAGVAQLQRMPA